VFNVTPSPGGTCCLGNAARDLEAIVQRLGCAFDRQRLARELYGEDSAGPAQADQDDPHAVAAEAESAA
jgi:malate dehydrogenase (quinone)